MTLLSLPKTAHPDFSAPKKKPVCGVELDLSNPITRGLAGWYIFDTISADSDYTFVGNSAVKVVGTAKGMVLDIPGSTNDQIKPVAPTSGRGKNMTILGMANYDVLTRDHAMFDINEQDLLIWADWEVTPDRLRTGAFAGVALNGTSGELGSTTARPDKSYLWGAQIRKNGTNADAQLWIEGKITATWTDIGNRNFDLSSNWSIGANWGGVNKVTNGNYTFVYVWMRTLSDEEMRSMSKDPYQILKPVVEPWAFHSLAVTPLNQNRISSMHFLKMYQPIAFVNSV